MLSNDGTRVLKRAKTKLDRLGIFHQYMGGKAPLKITLYTHGMNVSIIGNT